MVESLTYFGEFIDLIPIVPSLIFKRKTLFSKFPDLDLVALVVEELALVFLEPDPKDLNFIGKALNFNCLKDNNELDIVPQVGLFVIGQVLDS